MAIARTAAVFSTVGRRLPAWGSSLTLTLATLNLAAGTDDEQFKEEKAVIIKEISLLQPLERQSVSADESLDAGPFSPMSP